MKVFLTIWILAVLIQEVTPSTLVRLPRHADKNLSLVHTEYEAKYEQKGKHGNGSYSSVSGKQQIVHDNCAQDWNSFAEKCALLIKDLVASLANAVSSTPGDATNLQLHIKNTFRHFDNTHNCTCLNHTGKTLPDLTPLFKNITVNTVGPDLKTDAESDSETEKSSLKCGGNGQPCDGGSGSDTKKDKNIMPKTNTIGGDKNGFHQKHIKENGQPVDELWNRHYDEPQTGHFVKSKLTKEPKQQNHALTDSEDLDMNPENAESSNLQSTNNNRRQIKDPQEISKNSGESNFKPLANHLKHSSPNPKHPKHLKHSKGVRHPFLVTSRPHPQPNEPFESPALTPNHTSLTGSSLNDDFSHTSEHKPPHDLHSQKHPSVSAAIPHHSSSVNSNGAPSSASHHLVSPNNENSSPNKNYLSSASHAVTEPHSSFYNEKDPKKVFSSHNPESHQSPKIISGDPFAKDYNSEPELLAPAKSGSNELYAQSLAEDQPIYISESETEALPEPFGGDLNAQLKQLFPEKPDSQALNPAHTLIEQLENNHKLMPLVKLPKKPILTVPNLRSPMDALNALPPTIIPEESLDDSHVFNSGFVPEKQFKKGVDEIKSPITKSSQQPDTEGYTSDSSPAVSDNYNSNKNLAATTLAVPVESAQSVAFPGELSLPKTVKPESSGLIPEKTGNHHDSESPLFNKNQKSIEDIAKEWLQFTTPRAYELDKTSAERSTKRAITETMPEEDQEALKKLPSAIKSHKNFPHSSKPDGDVVTLNPSPVYKPSSTDSNSNPLSDTIMLGKDSAILSPEDILPIGGNGQLFFEGSTTPECDQTTGHNLGHTISTVKPVSTVPEVVSQQSEISTPVEKQLHDKSNKPIVPESQITGHPVSTVPKSNFPQNILFNTQNPDTETVSSSMGKIHHSKQSIQEEMVTTPLPFQAAIGHPEVAEEDPEIYESNGKDFTETEIPMTSNIAVVSITKDQEKQPNTAGGTPQSGEQVKTSVVAPEIAVTTPVIVYPVKYFSTSPEESPEQSYQESNHPVLTNNDLSDSKEEPLLFSTPVPLSSVEPIQAAPGTAEQQNSNADSSIQPTATTESCSTSDSPSEQEHPLTNAPVRESNNVQHPEVMDKPDNNLDESTPSNFHHHPQSGTYSNSHISSTHNPESHLETSRWKPAQPGALIHNNKAHPHQNKEQNPLLIQPTTFQTTSEDPTPSQVNASGLLTRTTSVPLDSDETVPVRPSTSPKTTSIYEHDDDDEEDCCSCESCTEEEITDPKQYKETACKDLEEARKELKAIFDKIKKKLKCGRKGPQTITSS